MSDPILRLIRDAERAQQVRHLAAVRPLPPLDEAAFDVAETAFHRALRLHRPGDECDWQEAVREALEAFLGTYEEIRRR